MNHLLHRIRRDDPQASLSYLAYYECMDPPTVVLPDEGIFLEYAPIERNLNKPLVESGQNSRLQHLLSIFGKETAKVLEYWLDNSLFSNWTKPPKRFKPNASVIRSDFKYYRDLGFTDISSFACYLGSDYEDLYNSPDISPFASAYLND